MIYLIETTYYNKNTKEVLDLLKIGYTEDNIKENRFTAYRLHNPGFRLLYEIPGYNEDIEKRIQYKFKDLIYSEYGREWFYYSDDIINFFKDIDKIDLYSLPKSISRKLKVIIKEVRAILGYILVPNEVDDYLEKLILLFGNDLNEENVLNYLKDNNKDLSRYYKIVEFRKTGIYSKDDIINQEVSNFLREYQELHTIYDKLRYLCESKLSSEALEIVLGQMSDSDEIKSYYTTLGPERLYTLGYNLTKIKRELSVIVFNPLLLQNHVYQDFKVGDKLSLAEIKQKLFNIYSEINYDKSAKANDIEDYFEIKKIVTYEKNSDGSRKQVRGYELLSKKF